MRAIKNFDPKRKERQKVIKVIVQTMILLFLATVLASVIFTVRRFEEPKREEWENREGFIALSYFGVARRGTPRLIAKEMLDRHLSALAAAGYETISQQDLINYYRKGTPLPQRALFLAFEDGRNDSSLFAQPILEKLNYKATMLSYANKIGVRDTKFLQPKDFLKKQESGYWELGSNGYRLTYINIFTKDDQFFPQLDEGDFIYKADAKAYNHYLMDFLRDEDLVPTETRLEMQERIRKDYQLMEELYQQELGFMPAVYMIMHANSLYGGMHKFVAEVNNECIRKAFSVHFNREGCCFNTEKGDPYNLTRLQPSPWWYTNHLLMKIKADTKEPLQFVVGDRRRAKKWRLLRGAAEFLGDKIVLTSEEGKEGRLVLKNSDYGDLRLKVLLEGNVIGKQTIYLRKGDDEFIRFMLHNNQFILEQKVKGGEVERLLLYSPDDLEIPDKVTAAGYSSDKQSLSYSRSEEDAPLNVEYLLGMQRTRELELTLDKDRFSFKLDGEEKATAVPLDPRIRSGELVLESSYSEEQPDKIYDGVFSKLRVTAEPTGEVLFDNNYGFFEKLWVQLQEKMNVLFDWSIETF